MWSTNIDLHEGYLDFLLLVEIQLLSRYNYGVTKI
jgi:hypothetical protein